MTGILFIRYGARVLLKFCFAFIRRIATSLMAISTLLFLSMTWQVSAKTELPLAPVQALLSEKRLVVGLAVSELGTNSRWQLNPQQQFPLMSVFKFPQALLVLKLVDEGKLKLDQQVSIDRRQLMLKTWSPMLKDHLAQQFSLSILELLRYSVSLSDNNACDILFNLIGGPAALQQYFVELGITDVQIRINEFGLNQKFSAQYENWIKPTAALELLEKFYAAELLSSHSQQLLWDLMLETPTGQKRLKAGIGSDALLAHKTGTSSQDTDGLLAGINDIGIVQLPDGRAYAIAVFVKDSYESFDDTEKLIAEISHKVYQAFTQQ
jgi:beta-lactamase class A PER